MGREYTESQKKATYKWRENNNEKHKNNTLIHMRKYRLKLRIWKEIKFEFFNILLII